MLPREVGKCLVGNQMSLLDVRPVCLAMRASIRGPISSLSWNANVTSDHPPFERILCEPFCRLMCQPERNSALKTSDALAARPPLPQKSGNWGWGSFPVYGVVGG